MAGLMTTTQSNFLSGRDVTREYHSGRRIVSVLDKADFDFEPGSFTAIIGRSGAGKTTLLNLCGGIDRPDSGVVSFEGSHLENFSDSELAAFRNEKVGFVFQNFFLRESRTILDNVMVPLLLGQNTISEARARAGEALREVGLEEMIYTKAGVLSGGQKQRVAIARAIANHPKLILADEPTGSLDTETSREILELLFRYNREKGATVIVVTHDPLVEKFGVPMITLKEGKVVPVEADVHLGDVEPRTAFSTASPVP